MSSSPYPILDNRPIDKWKVTELKEELKKRGLITRGLKDELIRRLDDALRAEEEESEKNSDAADEEEDNQKAEIAPLTGGDVTPDRNQIAPVAPVEAETTPAAETVPESNVVETMTIPSTQVDDVRGVASLDSSVIDVKPQEVDVKDRVETEVSASEESIQKSENKEPISGLDDAETKEAMLDKSATYNNQVPVTGFEVMKSDCISTDSMSNNEKIELKDNEKIADNVKLEKNVNKSSQEPSSTVLGESHPMDVEQKGGDNSEEAANADMTKGNNIIDAGDSEKLNLDRSSGDESMEDEIETKQSDEVVNKSEKIEMIADEVKIHADNMNVGEVETPEIKSHQMVDSDKRKLSVNDQEAVGNNEPAKRQRRWNSESIKVPEAQATNNAAHTTTPRSTGLKRDFSRSDSSVSEDGPKERVVPPSTKEPTNSLRIDRFLRPFTLKAVQELLGKTGNVTSFWMDQIKTHCYVSYSSVEEATATREAVYNLQWPPNGGRFLIAEFVGPEEVKAKQEPPPLPSPQAPSRPHQTALPPPPPLNKSPPIIERLPLPPPPPPLVPEEQEPPIVTLDDLFKKTKAIPRIYYLPLSEEQVAAKLAANNK